MSRTALITGASRGLGLALTQKFLGLGDTVYGVSRTQASWGQAKKFLSPLENLHPYSFDVSSEAQVRRGVKEILKHAKKIDILINNAGYGGDLARIEDLSAKDLQWHLEINLKAAFYVCKYALPAFRKQGGGTIINISSMAGKRAVPRLFAYSAAKFGMVALSQCLAKENDDIGLKCFTVCPGGINTDMRAAMFGKEDADKQQSADYVAGVILDVLEDKTPVDSGGDIVIRHGAIAAVNPCPGR